MIDVIFILFGVWGLLYTLTALSLHGNIGVVEFYRDVYREMGWVGVADATLHTLMVPDRLLRPLCRRAEDRMFRYNLRHSEVSMDNLIVRIK